MADYRVDLEIFAGPLDLLLYLVRKDEVDIYDIPISRITDQYIRYIEMLKSLDMDLAGDFLVMAATLMQIKSAMLLPKAEPEMIGEDEFSDPRAELIRQLLEYKKFKDAANLLVGREAADLSALPVLPIEPEHTFTDEQNVGSANDIKDLVGYRPTWPKFAIPRTLFDFTFGVTF